MNSQKFTQADEEALRETLKRCSPETIEAAIDFRKTGNTDNVGVIILGIIERFAEPDKKELLKNPPDDMLLAKELELDSLTMVEIVLMVEDAVGAHIDNSDVQNLKTLGDIKNFITSKASA